MRLGLAAVRSGHRRVGQVDLQRRDRGEVVVHRLLSSGDVEQYAWMRMQPLGFPELRQRTLEVLRLEEGDALIEVPARRCSQIGLGQRRRSPEERDGGDEDELH